MPSPTPNDLPLVGLLAAGIQHRNRSAQMQPLETARFGLPRHSLTSSTTIIDMLDQVLEVLSSDPLDQSETLPEQIGQIGYPASNHVDSRLTSVKNNEQPAP